MDNIFSLLITRIKSVFSKRPQTSKYSHLERRLKALSIKKDSLSLKPKSGYCAPSNEDFKIFDKTSPSPTINTFEPRSLKRLPTSMASIWAKREEEERQRIIRIEKSIAAQLDEITSYIKNRNVGENMEEINRIAIIGAPRIGKNNFITKT